MIVRINVRQKRMGIQEWTIQRKWQHFAQKTRGEDKETK
jgi:hypothetical protein